LKDLASFIRSKDVKPNSRVNGQLRRINNWPALAARAHWNVAELASLCGVSVRTLERDFLKTFGLLPHKWMQKRRLEPATTDLFCFSRNVLFWSLS
jgi:AraC-like DNA-binding protein